MIVRCNPLYADNAVHCRRTWKYNWLWNDTPVMSQLIMKWPDVTSGCRIACNVSIDGGISCDVTVDCGLGCEDTSELPVKSQLEVAWLVMPQVIAPWLVISLSPVIALLWLVMSQLIMEWLHQWLQNDQNYLWYHNWLWNDLCHILSAKLLVTIDCERLVMSLGFAAWLGMSQLIMERPVMPHLGA